MLVKRTATVVLSRLAATTFLCTILMGLYRMQFHGKSRSPALTLIAFCYHTHIKQIHKYCALPIQVQEDVLLLCPPHC